ncbi:hypothetical protein FRACA_200005 [Frankia canadensis]|uniref:Uncharacterized protein n=1 Tax=Frankia canadensis TaxID=1836972 RepID=A0A2I2KQ17_9ACTN|nr:hypothetical protein FRACA_200005 [Frankia canadensis]SOU55057.1 hypothetical protein FRACA_200005 [Frankia canadensis]
MGDKIGGKDTAKDLTEVIAAAARLMHASHCNPTNRHGTSAHELCQKLLFPTCVRPIGDRPGSLSLSW